MFTFLSPLFLIGILSAAIPLIIHLSRSRRTKKLQFSTTRFFTDQFLRSYRMSRLKELLLLACRMALCALFAVALARPLVMPRAGAFGASPSRSIVLVLDDSASMGYVENGVALFERARAAARELLAGLRPGDDSASIVLAGRRATGSEALFPEPTSELGDVIQAVDALNVTALGTDLSAAIEQAEAIIRGSSAASKEIYVLSDLQTSGWGERSAAEAAESEILYFFVRVRPTAPENVAITAVRYAAARPMVGVPFSIHPHVRLQGERASPVMVRLLIDNQKIAERPLEKLQSGRWAVPRFTHTFTNGGWHSGYVEVDDDTLAADNRRYFAFEVLDSIKLLAVNGAPSQVPRLDELFFLKTALSASVEGQSSIQLASIGPAALAGQDLAGYRLVVLANVANLPPAAIEKLEAFVDRGRSLLVFLGDKVDRTLYNQTFAEAGRLHGGLLPARLVEIEGDPAKERQPFSATDFDVSHPVLAVFDDPRFATLAGVTFKALWKVDPVASSVLMRVNTGSPLLCEKAFGKGRVLLFTSTCDRDWTNFPVRPAFLPWLYRIVGYLAQEPLGREGFYATGDRVPLPVAALEGLAPVQVRKPNGALAQPVAGSDPEHPLDFTDTKQPGVYSVYKRDQKDVAQLFVANLESSESDLTYVDDDVGEEASNTSPSPDSAVEARLKELLPGRPLVSYVPDPAGVADVAVAARRGYRLWDIILVVVLGIALLEPWLANRLSLRYYTRPPDAGRRPFSLPAAEPTGAAACTGGLTPRRSPRESGSEE
jgi:Aerotolerance regulator N-terminal/von Willebrand factor type A domain